MKYFLSKRSQNDKDFDKFYSLLNKEFNCRELTLFLVCLVHQKAQSDPKETLDHELYLEKRNFCEFIRNFKTKLSKFGEVAELERLLSDLQQDRVFWRHTWGTLAFSKRKNKDYFKIYLPKLIEQISGEVGMDSDLKVFLDEREQGRWLIPARRNSKGHKHRSHGSSCINTAADYSKKKKKNPDFNKTRIKNLFDYCGKRGIDLRAQVQKLEEDVDRKFLKKSHSLVSKVDETVFRKSLDFAQLKVYLANELDMHRRKIPTKEEISYFWHILVLYNNKREEPEVRQPGHKRIKRR